MIFIISRSGCRSFCN